MGLYLFTFSYLHRTYRLPQVTASLCLCKFMVLRREWPIVLLVVRHGPLVPQSTASQPANQTKGPRLSSGFIVITEVPLDHIVIFYFYIRCYFKILLL